MKQITPENCEQVLAEYKNHFKNPDTVRCEVDVLLQYLQQHGMDMASILGCPTADNTVFLTKIITFLNNKFKQHEK